MKKIFFGTLLLGLLTGIPIPTMARVDVGISINLPLIQFSSPPEVVVLPGTDVYVDPDLDVDIFFYDGWWWRLWEGRWYRSLDYSSGWEYYESVPSFYIWIPSDWRDDYRNHRWEGHEWNYQRIPHQQLKQNWNTWQKNRYWEKQNSWGVKNYKPQTRLQQPPQSVQPQSQTKPQSRETVKPQNSRSKSKEMQPQSKDITKPPQSRPQTESVQPQSQKTVEPQNSRSKSGEVQQQSQTQPKIKEAAKPVQSQSKSKEIQHQRSQPQEQKSTQESKPQEEKSKGGERDKQNNN
jgi:hypothetical protein